MKEKRPWTALWKFNFGLTMFLSGLVAYDVVERHVIPRFLKFRIYDASPEETVIIKETMATLHPPITRRVKAFICVDSVDRNIRARHIHDPVINGTILISDGCVTKNTVVHESMHAFSAYLPKSAWNELKAIKRADYVGDDWGKLNVQHFPKAGFVTPYGLCDELEDVATFGAELYTYLMGEDSVFNRDFDKTHPAWKAMLGWFLRWDFISEEHYKKLSPIFNP